MRIWEGICAFGQTRGEHRLGQGAQERAGCEGSKIEEVEDVGVGG